MGLFDMFGAGGGSLQIQPTSPHVAAGSAIAGSVVFLGGRRAQSVTNVTLRLTMEQRTMQMTNQGMQPQTQSREVVPATIVAQAFATTPGQPSTFPFQLAVPPGLPSSTPGAVTFHLRASADIDGEIDPGCSLEVQVVGTGPAAMPGAMPMGAMPGMGAPMAAMPMGAMPGAMMGAMPGMGAAMPGMPMGAAMPGVTIASGTRVIAQWTDGQLHPGVVRGLENGFYRVDWDDARLGANSYVYPQQVQVMTGAAMPGMHAPPHHVVPQHAPSHQQGHAPPKGMHDPYGKGAHPGMQQQHHGKPGAMHDPHAKGMGSMGHPPTVGAAVMAQHPNDHQWYPARVAAMQSGMIGVDWDDPRLGQSTWVAPTAVRGR